MTLKGNIFSGRNLFYDIEHLMSHLLPLSGAMYDYRMWMVDVRMFFNIASRSVCLLC